MEKFYQKSAASSLKELEVVQSKGLSSKSITSRLEKYGPNQLAEGKKINPFKLFISQFNDILVIVLIVAATVSLGLSFVGSDSADTKTESHAGETSLQESDSHESEGPTEALLIYGIVLAIAIIGFLNEYKAEKTVEALKKLVGQYAKVRRDGEEMEIEASQLVPGDILILEEGMKIPADSRLVTVKSLSVNEASLTGESVPSSKNELTIKSDATLGDQRNMVFSGTIISSGTAEAVVVGTGSNTEIGKIAHMVNEVEEEETPMQKKLDALGRKIGAVVLVISIVVFIIIYFFDKELVNESTLQRLILAFTAAVALAVAAIPEGLAFVVRISLALGARRMASKDALVRKLSAVEALGSTDTICSDKTGTLTRGEMTVRKIWTRDQLFEVSGTGYIPDGDFSLKGKKLSDNKSVIPILRIGALCNNSKLKKDAILGDPTEGALLISAAKAGLDHEKVIKEYRRIDEIPFSSDRKMMTTIHKTERGYLVAAKGATDILLEHCDRIVIEGKVHKLTPALKKKVKLQNSSMAKEALRVLGFAYKEEKTVPKSEKTVESKLIFLGMQGMMDPPRVEVKEVMNRVTAEAGMRVLMITGDHIDTAQAVAKEIGIEGEAISGSELDLMTQAEFEKKVERISVYARVNPEHKIRIVQALKKHGHQVAMTGDGVNDAPAIKAADIGIAMGVTGTDAAKEAADLILLDDQFLTIIDAIEEGRGIFDNVRKFVNYLLSANIAEVITILGGVVFMGRLVLSAAQLLFINIVTDGIPAVALGSDPAERDIMRFKPHRFQGSIINNRVWLEMGIFGTLMSVILLSHFWWIAEGNGNGDLTRATSVAFAAMVIYEMVRLVGIRSDYKIKWFSNPWLSVAILASLLLQVAVLYVPSIASIFNVGPILAIDWIIISIGAVFLLVIMKGIDWYLDQRFPSIAR